MKNAILLLIFISLTSCLESQPQLEIVGGKIHDWGRVHPNDTPLKTRIEIKNTGGDLLRIYGVKPSCGCTTAPIEKKKLEPGESTFIDVELELRNDEGKNSKSIEISSNDPNFSKVEYVLRYEVEKILSITPRYINFETHKVGDLLDAVVYIKNNTNKDFKIQSVETTHEGIKTEFVAGGIIKANTEAAFKVVYIAKVVEELTGQIKVTFEDKSVGFLEINYFGEIQ